MISYIVDENGNKTHVVIPIEEWDTIGVKQNNNHTTMMPVFFDDCPNKQLYKMLPLIESMELDSIKDWKKQYKIFYKYMERLKSHDIEILYLIRSNEFIYNISHCDNEDILDRIILYYGISKVLDSALTIDDCKEISRAVFTMDDETFLKFFNGKYKINAKDRKIRIDAEINRLFIYDLMERFPRCMELEYDITAKEAQEKLMKYLYENKKGAKTQVQRALRQANSYTPL